MIVSNKTQTLCFSEDIDKLLCQIDVKISEISKQKLDSERYGFSCKSEEGVFFILTNYRKILEDKAKNKCCLKNYLVDDIINIIKQYLSSGKLFKLKQNTENKLGSSKSEDIVENGINMTIIYQNYGNTTIHNSTFNRYVTETVQDTWDQTDW